MGVAVWIDVCPDALRVEIFRHEGHNYFFERVN